MDTNVNSPRITLEFKAKVSKEQEITIEKAIQIQRFYRNKALAFWQDSYKEGTNATTSLTSDRVKVTNLQFTRLVNTGAHDSVSVVMSLEYNTTNLRQYFAQMLNFNAARVSAATFDSDVVPSGGSLNLGLAGQRWDTINQILYFGTNSNAGIGVAPQSAAKLQIGGGDLYIDNSGGGNGIIIKDSGGNCWKWTPNASSGAVVANSVTCP